MRTRSQVVTPPAAAPSPTAEAPSPPAQPPVAPIVTPPPPNASAPAMTMATTRVDTGRTVHPHLDAQDHAGDKVTAVFAEELYTPKQFNSYRVGPYTYETRIMPGETPAMAFARAFSVVNAMGEAERARKRESYLTELAKVVGAAARAGN